MNFMKWGLKSFPKNSVLLKCHGLSDSANPGTGDYSVDRHKMLENQQDIDTIVKRIQKKRTAWEAEERARVPKDFPHLKAKSRKMTDIEIYEIGSQVLVNKFGAAGIDAVHWTLSGN